MLLDSFTGSDNFNPKLYSNYLWGTLKGISAYTLLSLYFVYKVERKILNIADITVVPDIPQYPENKEGVATFYKFLMHIFSLEQLQEIFQEDFHLITKENDEPTHRLG